LTILVHTEIFPGSNFFVYVIVIYCTNPSVNVITNIALIVLWIAVSGYNRFLILFEWYYAWRIEISVCRHFIMA